MPLNCFMLGPGPPDTIFNAQLLYYNFRYTKIMNKGKNDGNDTDADSLTGDLIDIAVGSDLDGLSDGDFAASLEELSDEDDGINVTIREGIKPSPAVLKPKVASVVVVPNRNPSDLIPKEKKLDSTVTAAVTPKTVQAAKGSNKNGSSKRTKKHKAIESKNSSTGSLISMLSKVNVSASTASIQSTPKRLRSPESIEANDKPTKQSKAPATITSLPIVETATSQTYRDAVLKSLDMKVCIVDRPPVSKDMRSVQDYLTGKIEEAVLQNDFIPLFRKNPYIGKDGVYLSCSNSRCGDWLLNFNDSVVPNINGKIIVVPQDQIVTVASQERQVRTVVHLPTRKSNDFILNALAGLNTNLNTEKWKISSRKHKGATKTTLFMRMDSESFEIIKQQNFIINWILGTAIVELENQKSKSKKGNQPSGASTATASGVYNMKIPDSGKPSSKEVMEVDPLNSGLAQQGGSVFSGNPNRN